MREPQSSIGLEAFEQIEANPDSTLFRIAARTEAEAARRPLLVLIAGGRRQRFAPLPAPPGAPGILRAGYSVPAALLDKPRTFALQLSDGTLVDLPPPTRGSSRVGGREQPIVVLEQRLRAERGRREDAEKRIEELSSALTAAQTQVIEFDSLQRAGRQAQAELLEQLAAEAKAAAALEDAVSAALAARQELELQIVTVTEELELRVVSVNQELERAQAELERAQAELADRTLAAEWSGDYSAELERQLGELHAAASESDHRIQTLERELSEARAALAEGERQASEHADELDERRTTELQRASELEERLIAVTAASVELEAAVLEAQSEAIKERSRTEELTAQHALEVEHLRVQRDRLLEDLRSELMLIAEQGNAAGQRAAAIEQRHRELEAELAGAAELAQAPPA